jgi:hypothetical protein
VGFALALPTSEIIKKLSCTEIYWGGENQVILFQKLIPFLFRIEKMREKIVT